MQIKRYFGEFKKSKWKYYNSIFSSFPLLILPLCINNNTSQYVKLLKLYVKIRTILENIAVPFKVIEVILFYYLYVQGNRGGTVE